MKIDYSKQTLNHPNPIARFAHQNRHRKCILLANNLLNSKTEGIIDYGCGQGTFVKELRKKNFNFVYGYEPFMEQIQVCSYILNDEKLIPRGNIELVTLFETIEHLDLKELDLFFKFCKSCLNKTGKILVSAPIEIGPAVILKDFIRSIFFKRAMEYKFIELIKSGLFGMNIKRTNKIKSSHKGFDFRKLISLIKKKYGKVKLLGYGPLPINTWYGNSQVYFQIELYNRNTVKAIN